MNPADAAATFLLGLLGTAHCVGMCGPLVLTVSSAKSSKLLSQLAYHAGRMATYVALGAVLGALAPSISGLAGAAGADPSRTLGTLQIWLSLLSSGLLLALGLERLGLFRLPATGSPSKLPGFARVRDGMLAGRPGAVFLFGVLMGTLPCGLSWAAFARALGAGGPGAAAVLVAAFALGTLPGLLLLGTAAASLARRHQKVFELAAAVLMVGMALRLGADALASLLG
ncbi:MAG: sulfite exporter TauE/SafE family protein [Myxococcales bacterium]